MILDDFAGPGGWDEGLRLIGDFDVTGVEWDESACLTAEAAGHKRTRADVTTHEWDGPPVDLYISSPSCTLFSQAGCRWATPSQQSRNRRSTAYSGVTRNSTTGRWEAAS